MHDPVTPQDTAKEPSPETALPTTTAWLYEHDGMIHDASSPAVLTMSRWRDIEEPWNESAVVLDGSIALMQRALRAVYVDAVSVGFGENSISDATRRLVEEALAPSPQVAETHTPREVDEPPGPILDGFEYDYTPVVDYWKTRAFKAEAALSPSSTPRERAVGFNLQLQWRDPSAELPPDPEGRRFFSAPVWVALSDGTVAQGECMFSKHHPGIHDWFIGNQSLGCLPKGTQVVAWMPFAVPDHPRAAPTAARDEGERTAPKVRRWTLTEIADACQAAEVSEGQMQSIVIALHPSKPGSIS